MIDRGLSCVFLARGHTFSLAYSFGGHLYNSVVCGKRLLDDDGAGNTVAPIEALSAMDGHSLRANYFLNFTFYGSGSSGEVTRFCIDVNTD